MAPQVIDALMWRGITPPPRDSTKTTCPECSHHRSKPTQRCLSVYPGSDWVEWLCHHCGWQDGEVVA